MGIASSTEKLKALLVGVDVIDIDSQLITESGVFCLYDGSKHTDDGVVSRNYALLVAGFSLTSDTGILPLVETVETLLYDADLSEWTINYLGTNPVVITDGGLFIYRVNVTIKDVGMSDE